MLRVTVSTFYNTKQMLTPTCFSGATEQHWHRDWGWRANVNDLSHPPHPQVKYITSHHATSFWAGAFMWMSGRLRQARGRAEAGEQTGQKDRLTVLPPSTNHAALKHVHNQKWQMFEKKKWEKEKTEWWWERHNATDIVACFSNHAFCPHLLDRIWGQHLELERSTPGCHQHTEDNTENK